MDLETLPHQIWSSLRLSKRFRATGSTTDTFIHNEMRSYPSLSYITYNKTKYTKLNPNLQRPITRNFQTHSGKFT